MWLQFIHILALTISLVESQSWALGNIMKSLRMELPFRSILLLRNEKDTDSCWTREDFDQDIPILNLNANQAPYLKNIFNSEILAMVCENRSEGDTIKALYGILHDIRYTPTIIMTQSDTNLSALFENCRCHKMLNVLALKDSNREFFYSYRAFPHLQVVKRRVPHIRRYFEPQLRNMEGHQINVLPGNIMPRTVVYRDAQGDRKMTGYLAHLIRNFVSTLNATMHICWDYVPEEESIDKMTVANLSKDGTVDFALVFASPEEFGTNSVVMEQTSWFLMLPMEANTPRARLFYRVEIYKLIPMIILLALVLSNVQRLERGLGPSVSLGIFGNYVLRVFLAQPFVLPHGRGPSLTAMHIYGLLFFSSILICSIFNVSLESWLVHPPVDRRILSFQDIQTKKLKILVYEPELSLIGKFLGEEHLEKKWHIFEITNSTKVYQRMRISLNPSYAYPTTTTLWPLLQLSQARLTRPIFRRSQEMVFHSSNVLAMPLPNNSIYWQAFTRFLLLTHDSGLYELWFRRTFNELVALGKMSYRVDNSTQPYQDLVWEDFFFIWLAYIGGIFTSLVVFIFEILYFKWKHGRRHD